VYEGRVVACDAATDLAVVKVEAEGPLPIAELGESNR
jgi:S1-C subfamily serine protease